MIGRGASGDGGDGRSAVDAARGLEEAFELSAFLAERPGLGDDELAELIEWEAERSASRGVRPTLDRYLALVPGLAGRVVPLDAAIEAALADLVKRGSSPKDAARLLSRRHPEIRGPIREALELSETVFRTTWVEHRMVGEASEVSAPAGVGPALGDGEPRYVLGEALGEGTFARTYRAVDRMLSSEEGEIAVAVKVLRHRADEGGLADGLAEARRARRVRHPNVISVLEMGEEAGCCYVVSEYVEGETLDRWLARRGRLEPREAAALVAQIADGVSAAHRAGVIHNDLTPRNVMIRPGGEPVVMDFGSAMLEASLGGRRGGSAGVAAIGFTAPEQALGAGGVDDVRVDVFALGLLAVFLMTGEAPNGTTTEEARSTLERIRSDPELARHPAVDGLAVERDLALVLRRATALSAEERCASASELASDLRSWCGSRPIGWTRPGPVRRARLLRRRHPVASVVGSLLVALAVGATLYGTYALATFRARERAYGSVYYEMRERMEAADTLSRVGGAMGQFWYASYLDRPGLLDGLLQLDRREDWNKWFMRTTTRAAGIATGIEPEGFEAFLWRDLSLVARLVEAEHDPTLTADVERHGRLMRAAGVDHPDWTERVEVMREIAALKDLWFETRERELTAADMARFRAGADRLRAWDESLPEEFWQIGLHRAVARTLRNVYRPSVLDEPELHQEYHRLVTFQPRFVEEEEGVAVGASRGETGDDRGG